MSLPPDTISSVPPSAPLKTAATPQPSVLRIKPRKRGWVPVSRALIDDQRLQFDTRAVANWLLAKPDGWQIRLVSIPYQLQQRAGPSERMGRDRVRRILRELEQAGYLTRARSRTREGRWTWHIELSDEPPCPSDGRYTIDGSTVDGSPVDGSAVDGSGVHLHNTLNYSRLDQLIPTTTSEAIAADNTAESLSVMDLRYPLILQGEAFPAARRIIETCPADQRQAVLDEIGAMQASGLVRRPLGLLKALVREAAKRQFFPNHSAPRKPNSAAKQRVVDAEPSSPLGIRSAPGLTATVSDTAQKTIARIRRKMQMEGD